MKCANLDSQSTTTHIVDFPLEVGKWVMKSIEISSHTWLGIGNGCRSP